MSHTCKNLLIRCMDFRLRDELTRFIENSQWFEGGFDVVSVAGAGKALRDENETVQDYFLRQVKVSEGLHAAKRIILLHHSQCGAYAQSYDFADAAEEKAKQLSDMREIKTKLLQNFPHLEVVMIWAELQADDGSRIDFQVVE